MNAIVHADYAQCGAPIRVALFDDRLEIENPGLLPFGLTIETSAKASPNSAIALLAEHFKNWGLSNIGEAVFSA
jgi:ATP-dependent DNA helicase RecG